MLKRSCVLTSSLLNSILFVFNVDKRFKLTMCVISKSLKCLIIIIFHRFIKFACKTRVVFVIKLLVRLSFFIFFCLRYKSYHLNWGYIEIVVKSVYCNNPSLVAYFNKTFVLFWYLFTISANYLKTLALSIFFWSKIVSVFKSSIKV